MAAVGRLVLGVGPFLPLAGGGVGGEHHAVGLAEAGAGAPGAAGEAFAGEIKEGSAGEQARAEAQGAAHEELAGRHGLVGTHDDFSRILAKDYQIVAPEVMVRAKRQAAVPEA